MFLPDYTGSNPYQKNLAAALDEEVIIGGRGEVLPLLRTIRSREDVSVIHLHWLHPYIFGASGLKTAAQLSLTILQLIVLGLRGVPVVWTVHNVVSHESPCPRVERWFKHVFVRFGFCSGIFVHCRAVAERLVDEYNLPGDVGQRVSVIPHGHYVDNYADEITKAEARTELGLGPDETVFLYFGQIRPHKAVPRLIETFKSVEDAEYRLLIVGRPMDESLERTVREKGADDARIRPVLEFVPDEEIQRYMNAADAVVLPYNDITTSGSAILAMSFGKAIIIPRDGCVPELLDEDGALMYPPGDEEGLRDALVEARTRDLASMGEHNGNAVRRYDWDDIAETTSRVYSRVR